MNPINQNAAAQYQLQIAVGEDDKLYPAMPTLRDQFAMAALHGLIAAIHGDVDEHIGIIADNRAYQAYRFADAMLKAREVK